MVEFDKETLLDAQISFVIAAHLVADEPSREWLDMCKQEDVFANAPFGTDDPAVVEGMALCKEWLDRAYEGDVEENLGSIKREWLRLFVGVGKPEAPSWETYFVDPNHLMFGENTLAVRRMYRSWGLEFKNSGKEPDDSLGLLLEFCASIAQAEVDALDSLNAPMVASTPVALEDALVHHILPWLPAWRYLVANHAKSAYYRGIGEYVFGLVRSYVKRFGVVYREDKQRFFYEAPDKGDIATINAEVLQA